MGAKVTKTLLFVDSPPCHSSDTTSLRNIKAVFFPPNCTSHLQPLDAGIIKCAKQGYRTQHVQHLLAAMERSEEEKISILDAMHMISCSLSAVSQSTIANSFKHCGFVPQCLNALCIVTASIASDSTSSMEKIATPVDDHDFGHLNSATTFTKFVEVDDNVATNSELLLDETILPVANATATSD